MAGGTAASVVGWLEPGAGAGAGAHEAASPRPETEEIEMKVRREIIRPPACPPRRSGGAAGLILIAPRSRRACDYLSRLTNVKVAVIGCSVQLPPIVTSPLMFRRPVSTLAVPFTVPSHIWAGI